MGSVAFITLSVILFQSVLSTHGVYRDEFKSYARRNDRSPYRKNRDDVSSNSYRWDKEIPYRGRSDIHENPLAYEERSYSNEDRRSDLMEMDEDRSEDDRADEDSGIRASRDSSEDYKYIGNRDRDVQSGNDITDMSDMMYRDTSTSKHLRDSPDKVEDMLANELKHDKNLSSFDKSVIIQELQKENMMKLSSNKCRIRGRTCQSCLIDLSCAWCEADRNCYDWTLAFKFLGNSKYCYGVTPRYWMTCQIGANTITYLIISAFIFVFLAILVIILLSCVIHSYRKEFKSDKGNSYYKLNESKKANKSRPYE